MRALCVGDLVRPAYDVEIKGVCWTTTTLLEVRWVCAENYRREVYCLALGDCYPPTEYFRPSELELVHPLEALALAAGTSSDDENDRHSESGGDDGVR